MSLCTLLENKWFASKSIASNRCSKLCNQSCVQHMLRRLWHWKLHSVLLRRCQNKSLAFTILYFSKIQHFCALQWFARFEWRFYWRRINNSRADWPQNLCWLSEYGSCDGFLFRSDLMEMFFYFLCFLKLLNRGVWSETCEEVAKTKCVREPLGNLAWVMLNEVAVSLSTI